MAAAADRKVKGFCPSCRKGGTLFLGEGGLVTCSYAECPAPDAADELLQGGEKFFKALAQINVIRSSITARQTLNWSLHIYTMVQALNEVGFKDRSDEIKAKREEQKNKRDGYRIEREMLEAEGLFCGSVGSVQRREAS